jgi:hypothetical protein
MTTYINEKIEILHDLCILRSNATKQEAKLKDILNTCKTEIQIDQILHNVICGNETIKDLIKRKYMN